MGKSKKIVKLDGRQYYSENFKKQVVREVESGRLSKEAAKQKYNIGGNSAILNWCRKYGKTRNYKQTRLTMAKDKRMEEVYKKRIAELEEELSDSKLQTSYYRILVEELEKEGIYVPKKPETLPLPDVVKKKKHR